MGLKYNKLSAEKIVFYSILWLCFFSATIFPVYSQTDTSLTGRIYKAAAETGIKVSDVQPLETNSKLKDLYSQKYQLFIEQPIDHQNPSLGTFRQKVILFHAGYERPVLFVTEGYASRGANPGYNNELSTMFHTNMIEVEHRYFSQSVPFRQQDSTITDETLDWSYMTALNEAADLHNINQFFKNVYSGKWIATGISKGGQTTMFYTTYYPRDIDISVPYVGPLCRGVEDGRHEPFLEKNVGTAKDRERVRDFQIEFLKRRTTIQPMLEKLVAEKQYTFRIPLPAVYDYCVLEFPFAFWQWGFKTDQIPDIKTASDEDLFLFMVRVNSPDYFAKESNESPFFVQAAKELGYYGYDTRPLKKLLSIKNAKGYLNKIFTPEKQRFAFDNYLYQDVKQFLDTTGSKMMFIYGEYDPWSSVMPEAPVKNEQLKRKGKGRENMYLFIGPGGSHSTRINTLPQEMKQEAVTVLDKWLQE